MYRLQQQTESSLELGNDRFSEGGEVDVLVLVVDVLGQFGDTFCVGLTLENLSFAFQELLQFFIVCDDTVVDNGESEGRVTPKVK